jgi:methionyl-tRNA synthetase
MTQQSYKAVGKKIEEFRFRDGLMEAMNIARAGNKLLTETEPWKLAKTDPEATARILHTCVNFVARCCFCASSLYCHLQQKK